MRDCNILLDILPTTVTVDGEEYPIDTNFRTGIQFEMLISDRSVPKDERAYIALRLYFGENIPSNIVGAAEAMADFYRCGNKPEDRRHMYIGRRRWDKIYDFDADSALFYAAYLAQYGVDLNEIDYLHWWKFMAMFEGLHRDHEIQRIMQIRGTDLSTIENAKERKRIMRLQELYRIDAGLSAEEKAAIAGSVFA